MVPMRPARALLVATVVALCGGRVFTNPQSQAEPRAVDLLDRYDRGEFDAVVETFLKLRDVGNLREDLERNGPMWASAGGSGDEPRRRLVAATMALELANARLDDQWKELRSLVEWGCQLLRRGPPSEGERNWQLASLAVSEGALDTPMLFKVSGTTKSYGHLAHTRTRFPDEPRFVFAERFVVGGSPGLPNDPRLNGGLEPDADSTTPDGPPRSVQMLVIGPNGPDDFASQEAARRLRAEAKTRRETAVKRLREIFDDPDIGAEAALRAGHLLLVGLELDRALEALHVALRTSTSPYVTYLAHFFRGRVLERMNRLEEAERAYAAAADAVPHAQSAALARSALLIRAGRTAEAHALASASFGARPRPPDPWRLFPHGDYYRWPALSGELRKGLAR